MPEFCRHGRFLQNCRICNKPDAKPAPRASAPARTREGRAGAESLEDFVRGGYRGYFQAVAEDPMTFELTRRNAGTIRTLFSTPGIGAGVDELRADLAAAIEAGLMAEVDVEFTAAAMVGVGFEVGVRMVAAEPADPESAADFATRLFLGGLDRLAE